jgi:hypothetical protein
MVEKKEEKKEEVKVSEYLKVVSELPKQEFNEGVDELGNKISFITVEDAIAEILTRVRRMDKAL